MFAVQDRHYPQGHQQHPTTARQEGRVQSITLGKVSIYTKLPQDSLSASKHTGRETLPSPSWQHLAADACLLVVLLGAPHRAHKGLAAVDAPVLGEEVTHGAEPPGRQQGRLHTQIHKQLSPVLVFLLLREDVSECPLVIVALPPDHRPFGASRAAAFPLAGASPAALAAFLRGLVLILVLRVVIKAILGHFRALLVRASRWCAR
mmetsp:Transcript_46408/g.115481  ORF Transcript_46408/g.115481 Transcript_46408/m.115481 type:complete len:205 (+) Transcript_46408:2108-2722(+)